MRRIPSQFALFSAWMLRHMPRVLIVETERVGLSIGFVCTGIASILNLDRDTVLTSPVTVLNWSMLLIFGGVFTLWGMQTSSRFLERIGMMMAGFGCLIYSVSLFAFGDNVSAYVIGILFLFLALIKAVRLITSSGVHVNATRLSELDINDQD